jgi:hypothetical protein
MVIFSRPKSIYQRIRESKIGSCRGTRARVAINSRPHHPIGSLSHAPPRSQNFQGFCASPSRRRQIPLAIHGARHINIHRPDTPLALCISTSFAMAGKGNVSTRLNPLRLNTINHLRVRRPNQHEQNPCVTVMSSMLSTYTPRSSVVPARSSRLRTSAG